jgi:hypothetical protein
MPAECAQARRELLDASAALPLARVISFASQMADGPV